MPLRQIILYFPILALSSLTIVGDIILLKKRRLLLQGKMEIVAQEPDIAV